MDDRRAAFQPSNADQEPAVEQLDVAYRRSTYQLINEGQPPTIKQCQERCGTTDDHAHSSSWGASAYFSVDWSRQSRRYSDVEEDTSYDQHVSQPDAKDTQCRGQAGIRHLSPPRGGGNGIQPGKIHDFDDVMFARRHGFQGDMDG